MSDVLIIMGSDSDLPIMQEAAIVLDELGISYTLTIVSAHRTPQRMYEFGKSSADLGYKIVIAGAGGAAHLPGMFASLTTLPVIGVPIQSKTMNGMDSLYSIVQMPPGIPVATMAINGAKNAGLLAARFLAVYDKNLNQSLVQYIAKMEDTVLAKCEEVERVGFKTFLEKRDK